jgi:hypothetical protein
MLDEQVARFARDRILLEIGEQNTRLQAEIGRIRAEMAARGVLNSGMTLQRVAQACANAARDRGQLAWQILFRFVTTTGVRYHDGLADDLKALVSEFLPPTLVDLKGYPIHEAKRLGNEKATAQLVQIVESARTVALAKIKNEIDLFTVSLNSRQAMSVEKTDAQVFNIYSPVGSIQTGANAVAYVTQIIDASTKERLNDALAAVEEALATIDELPTHPKAEIIEIVREAKTEVAKAEPNATKLRSLLGTTATAIQTVASMKPAYELLKTGLAYLGIALP